jgi:hypothetical protein
MEYGVPTGGVYLPVQEETERRAHTPSTLSYEAESQAGGSRGVVPPHTHCPKRRERPS